MVLHAGENHPGHINLLIYKLVYRNIEKEMKSVHKSSDNIKIYHEYEGGIEKSILRITDLHHEACRVMTIDDREGRIFLSHPHANNGLFFLLTTKWKNVEKTSKKS